MLSIQTPYPITIAKDITLKPLRASDSTRYFEFVQANRSNLEQFDPFVTMFQSLDDVRAGLSAIEANINSGRSLTCGIWDQHVLIGWVNGGLDFDTKTLTLGYGLAQAYQGRGIVTRAVKAIIDYAFNSLGITHAELITQATNTPSIKVAERLGFKRSPEHIPPLADEDPTTIKYKYVLEAA